MFLRPAQDGTAYFFPAHLNPLSGNHSQSLPVPPASTNTSILNRASLSPSNTTIKVLPTGYFPGAIEEAHCRCQRCVDLTGFQCVPVYVAVTVLRPNGCYQGMQLFEEQIVDVVKSCACVNPDVLSGVVSNGGGAGV
ncbi:hypothetical protein ACOMHN_033211 [Nucella lapillus]